jgi:hypothetical protein
MNQGADTSRFFGDSIGAFQGGGLAQVGAIALLEERGVHLCAGASAGALVAALVACGMTSHELRATMSDLAVEDLCGRSRRGPAFMRALNHHEGLLRHTRIAALVLANCHRGGILDTDSLEAFVSSRLRTPHCGAGERRAGAGGFLYRLVAERDQRLPDDREQLVNGLGADPSDDVRVQVTGTHTVTLNSSASVNSLTSSRPREEEAA